MEITLQEKLKDIYSNIENNKAIHRLIELKEETNKAFEEQIEHLIHKHELKKKVVVPKISWRYIISMPFIYGVFIPSVIFHLCLELYQQICFRLYKIPLVDSKEYFIYDRTLLSFLNPLEKINCLYCSYVNNLIRYSTEIGGRTERYWCPIKYYRRISNTHSQYSKFISGKEKEDLRDKWEELRDFSDLEEKKD